MASSQQIFSESRSLFSFGCRDVKESFVCMQGGEEENQQGFEMAKSFDASALKPLTEQEICFGLNYLDNLRQVCEAVKTSDNSCQDELSTPDSFESDFAIETRSESEPVIKSSQSRYKNKLKELLEVAKNILKDICLFSPSNLEIVRQEALKSDQAWLEEGEKLEKYISHFETLRRDSNKEAKITLLKKLVQKRFCLFVGLYDLKEDIEELMTKTNILNDFKSYKDRISRVYFERTDFRKDDLFCWTLLVKIAILMIPQEKGSLKVLPLKKESLFFNYWLIESPMKQQNKELYKEYNTRHHMREALLRIEKELDRKCQYKLTGHYSKLLQYVNSTCSDVRNSKEINVKRLCEINTRRKGKFEMIRKEFCAKEEK